MGNYTKMTRFLIKNSNLILSLLIVGFAVGYIVFSSLSTSLDFKMDHVAARQSEADEEYGQILSSLGQARGKDYLSEASARLNLVEVDLTAGYLDLRPGVVGSVDVLAKNP